MNIEDKDYFLDEDIDYSLINDIPKKFLIENSIMPYKYKEDKLYIFCCNPISENLKNYIKFVYNTEKIIFKILSKEKIRTMYNNTLLKESNLNNKDKKDGMNFNIVKIINNIFNEAIRTKASDIHIEPFKEKVIVRFRKDGVLYKFMELDKKMYSSICIRIKILGKMNISQKFIPEDGKISHEINNKKYDLRVSTLPTVWGEKVVVRILDKGNKNLDLNELGFNNSDKNIIEKILKKKSGIILITGPTGSGKTTTLYCLLNKLNTIEKNIITIEDPVEYTMPFVNQVNVNNKSGLTFASGLRSILRQDPDIIMIGEIRDEETAEIAIRAAITGHLVLSTLHTSDAISSITRLKDMGIENYLISDTLIGVISQRLIRKLCPHCKTHHKKVNEDLIYKPNGCTKCNFTGYLGRKVSYEILLLDEISKTIIREGNNSQKLKEYYKKKNMKFLKDNMYEYVREGITSYQEYLKNKE